jgi:hypothetical protein
LKNEGGQGGQERIGAFLYVAVLLGERVYEDRRRTQRRGGREREEGEKVPVSTVA